ncbi:hypothetical protein GGR51DRAFT_564750 [Nemania sp. FL0031]|nr:hypothetical protein GGR51DRAFT_564750 [Nemania sp. FL0031]
MSNYSVRNETNTRDSNGRFLNTTPSQTQTRPATNPARTLGQAPQQNQQERMVEHVGDNVGRTQAAYGGTQTNVGIKPQKRHQTDQPFHAPGQPTGAEDAGTRRVKHQGDNKDDTQVVYGGSQTNFKQEIFGIIPSFPNEGSARVAHGAPQYNIENLNIASSSPGDWHSEFQYHVPHNICSPFVGRDDGLKAISNALFSDHQVDGARRFVVFGTGGSALSLNHQAKYEEAAQLFARALAWREKAFGDQHLETIESLDGLAATFHNEGYIGPAQEYYRRALTRRKSVLRKTHPHTLMNMSVLALMMLRSGDLEAAKTLSDEAYEAFQAHVGAIANSYAPIILGTCAQVQRTCKSYQKAEELVRKAIKGLEDDMLLPTHPDLLNYQLHLALILRDQHHYREAGHVYRQVLDGHKQRPGLPCKDEMICLTNLARVLEKQGDFEEAESAHSKAFYGLSNISPPNHPQTLGCLENCSRCLRRREKYDEAIEMYFKAVEGRKAKGGYTGPASLRNHCRAGLYTRSSRICEARFIALKEKTQCTEAPIPSSEEDEWAKKTRALINKSSATGIIVSNVRLKRGISISEEEGATKRLKLTT